MELSPGDNPSPALGQPPLLSTCLPPARMTSSLPSSQDEAPSDSVADQLHGPWWLPSTPIMLGLTLVQSHLVPPCSCLTFRACSCLTEQQIQQASPALPPLKVLVLLGPSCSVPDNLPGTPPPGSPPYFLSAPGSAILLSGSTHQPDALPRL